MSSSSTDKTTAEKEIIITCREGLHMRPAMEFVKKANEFQADITITKDAQTVEGKSIMQVTMLAAVQGTKLKISAQGPDARLAVDTLSQMLETDSAEKNT